MGNHTRSSAVLLSCFVIGYILEGQNRTELKDYLPTLLSFSNQRIEIYLIFLYVLCSNSLTIDTEVRFFQKLSL